ncbi:MAG: hypothetical protein KBC26_03475 [Candidatus Pacebacteria bacterium]|nr:hypothetical protein [Candidatus Paceibacterota bacterium]
MHGTNWFIHAVARARVYARENAIAVAIIVCATALVLGVSATQSIWLDEGLSISFSQKSVGETIRISALSDLHPPLYNMWLHFSGIVLGAHVFAYRFWSALAFLCFGFILWEFFRYKGIDKKSALWYLALSLSGPFVLYYASESRSYMAVMVVALLNIIAFDRLIDGRGAGKKHGIVYVATTIVGAYLFYPMLFLNVAQLVYVFIARRAHVARWILYWSIATLAYAPWLISTVLARLGERPGHFLPIPWWQIPAIIGVGFAGGRVAITDINHVHYYWPTALAVGVYALALLGITQWRKIKEKDHVKRIIGICAITIAVCLVISYARFPIFDPRYYAEIFPLFIIILIWSLEAYKDISRAWWRVCIVIILVSHVTLGALYLTHPLFKREQWKVIVPRIEQDMGVTDAVVFIGPYSIPPTYTTYQKKNVKLIETHPRTISAFNNYQEVEQHLERELKGIDRLWYSSFLEWQKDPQHIIRALMEKHFRYVKTVGIFKVSFDLYDRIK